MSKHRLLPALAVCVSALLVSGCGGSASPGLGVRVGDETISTSRIDEATLNVCAAFVDQLDADGQVAPLRFVKRRVVELFALRAQAEQVADDYDVSPSTVYQRELAGLTRAASTLPEEVRADYVRYASAPAFASDVQQQVGEATLRADGVEEPTIEESVQAGQEIFVSWPDTHDVEVNPKYGMELPDGAMKPLDTSLSYPLSDTASAGSTEETEPSYAGSLPSNQRCGG